MAKNNKILLSELRENPLNPRTITDAKFDKLCESLTQFPNILTKNKLKVDFSNENVILGGNMRFKALLALGYTEIPTTWIEDCSDLTEAEKQALIVLDNSSYGAWDFEMLEMHYEAEFLELADIELPVDYSGVNIDDFFKQKENEKPQPNKIILEYSKDEYDFITEKLKANTKTKEQIFYEAIKLL